MDIAPISQKVAARIHEIGSFLHRNNPQEPPIEAACAKVSELVTMWISMAPDETPTWMVFKMLDKLEDHIHAAAREHLKWSIFPAGTEPKCYVCGVPLLDCLPSGRDEGLGEWVGLCPVCERRTYYETPMGLNVGSE